MFAISVNKKSRGKNIRTLISIMKENLDKYLTTDWDEHEEKEANLEIFRQSIVDYLCKVKERGSELDGDIIKCTEILKEEFALNGEDLSTEKACESLSHIVKFADNLIEQPWREDFKRISVTSGGFYHAIDSVFDEITYTRFLRIMNFKNDKDSMIFEYPKNPMESQKELKAASLKLHIAYIICKQMDKNEIAVKRETKEDDTQMEIDVDQVDLMNKMADENNHNWFDHLFKKEIEKVEKKGSERTSNSMPTLQLKAEKFSTPTNTEPMPSYKSENTFHESPVLSESENEYPTPGFVEEKKKFFLNKDGKFPIANRRHTMYQNNREPKACPACTFLNDPVALRCEICEEIFDKEEVYGRMMSTSMTSSNSKHLRRSTIQNNTPRKGPPNN